MALILNEAQAEEPTIFEPSAAAALPLIIPEPAGRKHHHILPLNEHPSTLPLAPQPPSPNRHPTFLLNNFPHRPHYYQPDSVGAQPGYCLSPHKPAAEDTPSRSQKAAPASMIITKKILPIPPSLSPRVRQIFLNKINSQQAQSCAQLPRRKKKKAVEPLSLPPV
ncbi:hypothetical protein PtB15_1B991 [Puccinia triticina]|nr:hypothetical protein PtB15_1B991 [Puccinia triticina]